MSATTQDVSALEHLAYRIREDTHGCKVWDRQGIHVIFQRELVGMHLMTAIEIVVGHAQDLEAKTPAAITRSFTPRSADRPKRGGPSKKTDECPEHPGQPRVPFCGGHRADELAARYEEDEPKGEVPVAATPVDALRIAAGLKPKHQEAT